MDRKAFGWGMAGLGVLYMIGTGVIGFGDRPTPANAKPVAARKGGDHTVDVATGDPEMEAARAKARASLGEFWSAHDNAPRGVANFSLKVSIPFNASGGNEHFWLGDIQRKGNRFVGTINNEPKYAKHVKMGHRYEFGDAEMSDLMFLRNGEIVGNETMRPLRKRMPDQ